MTDSDLRSTAPERRVVPSRSDRRSTSEGEGGGVRTAVHPSTDDAARRAASATPARGRAGARGLIRRPQATPRGPGYNRGSIARDTRSYNPHRYLETEQNENLRPRSTVRIGPYPYPVSGERRPRAYPSSETAKEIIVSLKRGNPRYTGTHDRVYSRPRFRICFMMAPCAPHPTCDMARPYKVPSVSIARGAPAGRP